MNTSLTKSLKGLYIDFATGVEWSINDEYKIVISTPKYIGHQLGPVRLSDEGRSLHRSRTAKENKFAFEKITVFDDEPEEFFFFFSAEPIFLDENSIYLD